MPGVVTLLEGQPARFVEGLWAELAEITGLPAVVEAPFPHLTYHVAEQYDSPLLEMLLRQVAARTPPFRPRISGLGLFTGPVPVCYLAVAGGPALATLHNAVWQESAPAARGAHPSYHPDAWLPHITLASLGLDPDRVAAIGRHLATRDLSREVLVDNLTFIDGTGANLTIGFRCPLGAGTED